MKKLRDINLRLPQELPASPEWFWKHNIAEYFFYRELAALGIETTNFAKINVFCEANPSDYKGDVFDNVTNVSVKVNLNEFEKLSASELTEYSLKIMLEGVQTVLDHFRISSTELDSAVSRAYDSTKYFSIPIGKRSLAIAPRISARLHVRGVEDMSACVVVLVISRGRTTVSEHLICTTFPSPEIALARFESMSLDNTNNAILIQFKTAGANGNEVFGRTNFDHSGMPGIERIDKPEPLAPYFLAEPTFKINISSEDIACQ